MARDFEESLCVNTAMLFNRLFIDPVLYTFFAHYFIKFLSSLRVARVQSLATPFVCFVGAIVPTWMSYPVCGGV